jgi:hypothetical protein
LKAIIEFSIFNPLADMNRTSPFDVKDPDELDTFTLIVQNITDRVRDGMMNTNANHIDNKKKLKNKKNICRQDELYALSKRALMAKKIVLNHTFMPILIEHIKLLTNDNYQASIPFGPIFDISYNSTYHGQVISVWTIRTGLDEDINYFGPQKPFVNTLLVLIQHVAILCALFFAIILSWNYIISCYDNMISRLQRYEYCGRFFNNNSATHRRLFRPDHDDVEDPTHAEDAILTGDIDPRKSSPRNNSFFNTSVVKKRSTRKGN